MRQQADDHDERHDQAEQDDDHLLHVGPGDRLDAAGDGVEMTRTPMISVVMPVRPAEDDRQHDGRRVERDAHRQAALDQEDDAGQRARLGVEALFQILVGRVNVGAMEDRHRRGREDHHRDRQSEIELHEAHAVDVGLAGGGDEGDGARLRRHDGERHGVPRHGLAGQQILVDGVAAAALVEAVDDDEDERADQHHPVERSHEKTRVNT